MHIQTDIATVRKANLYIGTVALVTGCLMAFEFGRSMSYLHAITLCLLSLAVAFLPTMAHHHWKGGNRPTGTILAVVAVLFTGVEYFSHLGYTIGHRVRDTEEATVQNTKYDGRQEQVAEAKSSLALAEKQLGALMEQNGWAASVTADALRAKIESANLAIAQEAKRGGCGKLCLERTKERDTLQSQIALAEQKGKLVDQIEATKRWIADARTKAESTAHVSSKIVAQTKFVSQLATFEIEPGRDALTWTQIGIGAAISLVTTFLAMVCYFVAFGERKEIVSPAHVREIMASASPTPETMHAAAEHRPTAPLRPIAPHIPAFAAVRRVAAL